MTRVCLVGEDDCDLRYELLSRETSRDALSTYDLGKPYWNSVAVETISIGAAVSLLNDLNWYLVRFVSFAMVLEPSVSEGEWLSRTMATAIRDGDVQPAESGQYLKVYGVERDVDGDADAEGHGDDGVVERLVEPMYVTRTGRQLPEYDLRDVDDTLLLRVTETEFGG